MSTQNALPLPGPLISQIEAVAEAEHLTPEQLLQNLLAKHLNDKNWQELIEKGKQQSSRLGFTENDVDRLIHEHRKEKRQCGR